MTQVCRGKVLIVDDSSSALKMASLALKNAGYEVIAKKEAILVSSTIQREKPQIALFDVNMPAIQGDKLAEIVRGHPACAETVLLLYSSQPDVELETLARNCGADGFIQKGLDAGNLVRQVNRWMSRIEEDAVETQKGGS